MFLKFNHIKIINIYSVRYTELENVIIAINIDILLYSTVALFVIMFIFYI